MFHPAACRLGGADTCDGTKSVARLLPTATTIFRYTAAMACGTTVVGVSVVKTVTATAAIVVIMTSHATPIAVIGIIIARR